MKVAKAAGTSLLCVVMLTTLYTALGMTHTRNSISRHSTSTVDLHVDLLRFSTSSCGLTEKEEVMVTPAVAW